MILRSKHLLIVGASSGLGLELARNLARRNCFLTLFSRKARTLKDDQELAPFAANLSLISGDVRKPDDIERLAKTLETAAQPLDGIIYATGVSRPDFVETPDTERAIDTIRINLEGPIRVFYRLLPLLLNRPGTFLAGFTSMAGDRGMPRAHTYSASKAGFDRYLESLRIDLFDRGIHVFTIVPGYVDTPMSLQNRFPMPGIWSPGKAAEHLVHAMEQERLVIRFPWYHSLGMRLLGLLPNRWYWWLMSRQRTMVKIDPHPGDEFSWPSES